MEQDRTQRLQTWKKRLQGDEREIYSWVKKRKKFAEVLVQDGNQPTANYMRQLDVLSKAWMALYTMHKGGEPSLHAFMATYAPTMNRKLVDLGPIQVEHVLAALRQTLPSAAGPDNWLPSELRTACLAHHGLAAALAKLFNAIEASGSWPGDQSLGRVAMLPKAEQTVLPPLSFRPITVLSSLYRTWSKTRWLQLREQWVPYWLPSRVFGYSRGKSAEDMVLDVCTAVEDLSINGHLVGGLSYDLSKAFDRIPIELSLAVAGQRGCDLQVLRGLRGFYATHQKAFQVSGFVSEYCTPINGLIQGDPLSMVLLTSLVACWIEAVQSRLPNSMPQAYADDMSVVTRAKKQRGLIAETAKAHEETLRFEKQAGVAINSDKSFTFGHTCLKDQIGELAYSATFRLVGGSVVTASRRTMTQLDDSRVQKWKTTVQRVRHVPCGFFTKIRVLRSCVGQLHWGQGTHVQRFPRDQPTQSSCRYGALLAKCLLLFCKSSGSLQSLVPPMLDPHFGLPFAALKGFERMRAVNAERFSQLVCQLSSDIRPRGEGPISCLSILQKDAIFGDCVRGLLSSDGLPLLGNTRCGRLGGRILGDNLR